MTQIVKPKAPIIETDVELAQQALLESINALPDCHPDWDHEDWSGELTAWAEDVKLAAADLELKLKLARIGACK